MTKRKMTRKDALTSALEIVREWRMNNFEIDDLAATHTDLVIETLEKMVNQIERQQLRPKSKTAARIENEALAKAFIKKLAEQPQQVNAKWMTYHIRYIMSTQKAVAVADIAEEWGAINRVMVKHRAFYELNPDFEIPTDW